MTSMTRLQNVAAKLAPDARIVLESRGKFDAWLNVFAPNAHVAIRFKPQVGYTFADIEEDADAWSGYGEQGQSGKTFASFNAAKNHLVALLKPRRSSRGRRPIASASSKASTRR